jgi:hypothetical protein
MEVIKLENMGYREDMLMPGDVFLLQVSVTSMLINYLHHGPQIFHFVFI